MPLAALLALLGASYASAAVTLTYPTINNYQPYLVNATGTHYVRLNPDPVGNASEFFLLGSASAAVQAELPVGDQTFNQYNYDFNTKWGSLNGTFNVDRYKAGWKDNNFGGGEISLRYNRGAGDPAQGELWFLQLITTNDVLCKPQPGRACPAVINSPYIDPLMNDDTAPQNDPFYYNNGDKGPHYGGANFDLDFYDFSTRDRRDAPMPKSWKAELYMVQLAPPPPLGGKQTVYFLDGIQWGWEMNTVPEPGSMVLMTGAIGALVALRLRKK